MNTVIIAGAAGFIGRHLRHKLSQTYRLANIDMCNFDQNNVYNNKQQNNESFYQLDLINTSATRNACEDIIKNSTSVAAVINLAGYYDFSNKQSAHYMSSQFGFENLMDKLHKTLPLSVPVFNASSISIYKPTIPGQKITVGSELSSDKLPYIRNKIFIESSMDKYKERPMVSLVLGGVYSDNCELYILYQQLERIRQKGYDINFFPGDYNTGITYVHIDQVVRTFENCIDKFGSGCGDFAGHYRLLVGQRSPMTYKQLFDKACLGFHGKTLSLYSVSPILAQIGLHYLNKYKPSFFEPWMIDYATNHYEIVPSELMYGSRVQIADEITERNIVDDVDKMIQFAKSDPTKWKEINEARSMTRLNTATSLLKV